MSALRSVERSACVAAARTVVGVLLVVFVLLVRCPDRVHAAPPMMTWSTEEADTTWGAGAYCSFAVDAQGTPHIAYRSSNRRSVWYATRVGGTWTTERIAGSLGDYESCWIEDVAITVDREGRPHVAFINNFYDYDRDEDYGPHFVGYSTKSAGTWTTTSVDDCSPYGTYLGVTVALKPDGCPAVLYIGNDWCNYGQLELATRVGEPCNSWTSEVVPEDLSSCYSTFYLSLAFDRGGHPHAAYRSCVERSVRYARRGASEWTIESVGVEGMGSTYYPSLVLDKDDSPCISYSRGTTADLVYAKRSGGVWSHAVVDTVGSAFAYSKALVLDRNDNPHVAYVQFTPGDRNVRYAAYKGAAWKVVDVEAAVVTGLSTAIDVDLAGIPSIAYDLAGGLFLRQLKAAAVPETNEALPDVPRTPVMSIEPSIFRLGGCRIAITGSRSTRCDAEIYDASGRKVRTVELHQGTAGLLEETWNGTDHEGNPVAAGMYFVLVRVGAEPLSARVTRIR